MYCESAQYTTATEDSLVPPNALIFNKCFKSPIFRAVPPNFGGVLCHSQIPSQVAPICFAPTYVCEIHFLLTEENALLFSMFSHTIAPKLSKLEHL